MQAGEGIMPPMAHSSDHPKCPFCPIEPPKDYKTYDGDANDSTTLGANMNAPEGFAVSRESSARPMSRPTDSHKLSLQEPRPIGVHPDPQVGAYSCEPHHLVSGKQALSSKNEHNFERWIKASHGTIAKDTGYSVNNYQNGIWMPSIPEKTKSIAGSWAKMDRQEVANYIMKKTRRQFHKGGHSIPETRKNTSGIRVLVPDNERTFQKYNIFLIKKLITMDQRMQGWSNVCPLCFKGDVKKEKLQPNEKVNRALDRLAGIARKKITGPVRSWKLFISSLAWIYYDESSGRQGIKINL